MKRNKIIGVLLALMLFGSVFAAVPVSASETVAIDGDTSGVDNASTTGLWTNSDVDNVTIQMTEDQSVSASGSIKIVTNITAANATINSTSGSGTLEANTVDDGVYVNETGGSSSATLESLNMTFSVNDTGNSSGSVPDYINVSEDNWMENATQLAADDDGSEVHNYVVRSPERAVDVTAEVAENGEFNETSGEYVPNSTGEEAEFQFEVTRNNTTYENVDLDGASFIIELNKSAFGDYSDTNNLNTSDGISLDNKSDAADGDHVQWELTISNQNNNTTTWDATLHNVTVESSADPAVAYEYHADPADGPTGEYVKSYAVAEDGIVSPYFLKGVGDQGVIVIGALVLGAVLVFGIAYRNNKQPGQSRRASAMAGSKMIIWLVAAAGGMLLIASPFITAIPMIGMLGAAGTALLGFLLFGGSMYMGFGDELMG